MFKEIKREDLNELVDIYIEAFNGEPWNDNWTYETASKRLENMLDDSGFYGLKLIKDNEIVAFILGHEEQYYDGIMFNIKEFCVRKSIHGNNVGSKLLEEFEENLKERGVKEIVLMTKRHDKAEGFYSRRGYKTLEHLIFMSKEK